MKKTTKKPQSVKAWAVTNNTGKIVRVFHRRVDADLEARMMSMTTEAQVVAGMFVPSTKKRRAKK